MLLHGEFNVLEVEFVGSFDISNDGPKSKADAVGEKMEMYKHRAKTRPVLVVISLAGIKVCDRLGQSVLMAYPLRTIAYATCSPTTYQFAFLAQEPAVATGQQRCHLFKASSLEQVLEINGAIRRTFGMAQDLLSMMARSSATEGQDRNTGAIVDAEDVLSTYTATTGCSSSTASFSDYVKPRPTCSDHVYVQRRPLTRCGSCGAVRHGYTSLGHGGAAVADCALRNCYNSSYNYVEAKPLLASTYQECSALKGSSAYVDTGFRTDARRASRRTRRQSTTSEEVENYLCPLSCLAGLVRGASDASKTDLPPEQQQLCGPGKDCCAQAQSHAMPLRYQNDSPFRGLQEQQDVLPLVSPQRVDSLAKSNVKSKDSAIQAVDILKQVPWFQPEMQRERVIEILSKEEIGSFIVRNSSTHAGCFALSVKVPKFDNPTGIGHYLIQRTPVGGVKIKGLEKEWSSLAALVVHHTIMPELLPCTLVMPEGASRNPCASAASSDDYDNSKAYSSSAACATAALRTRTMPPRGFSTYGSTPRDGVFSSPAGESKLK